VQTRTRSRSARNGRTTTLAELAEQQGQGVDVARATLGTQINWGIAEATIDIAAAADHQVFELAYPRKGLPKADLGSTRRLLQVLQAEEASVSGRSPSDALAVALQCAATRAADSTVEGDDIRVGSFKYWKGTEDERRARTLRIIDRIQPGPYEDGQHLELLAREAAAIEMTLAPDPEALFFGGPLSRVLIGTTEQARSHAGSARRGDGVVITLSAGLLDFLDVVAQCVAKAMKFKPSEPAVSVISARTEDTAEVLAQDPAAVALMCDALTGWLCEGRIRPRVALENRRPYVDLLVSFAQRFVIAHEYIHAMHLLGWELPRYMQTPQIKEEHCDVHAVQAVFMSARADRVQPNIALQGAVLAIKSQEMIDRTLILACGGDESALAPSATHPPFDVRLKTIYTQYADAIRDRPEPRLAPEALTVPADTAEMIWKRAAPHLQRSLEHRILHPIWATRLRPHPRRDPNVISAGSGEHDHEATAVIDPADLDEVRKLAVDNDTQLEIIEQEGFTGLEVLAVISGTVSAVAFVMDAIDRRKGGQIFDLRPGAARLAYRTPDVMYGLVAIIRVDGSLKLEVKEPKTMFANVIAAVQKTLVGGANIPLKDLGSALHEQLGDAATVDFGTVEDSH
jgi:hypothetical protein